MQRNLYCATMDGIEAKVVEVEVSFTRTLPAFQITGLAGNAIQEAKQRVQSSLLINGFKFPPLKITLNLSPADLPKQGSFYDLPIALAIVMGEDKETQAKASLENEGKEEQNPIQDEEGQWFAFGELGLDGRVKNTNSIYPLILSLLSKTQFQEAFFLLPKEAKDFYSKIPQLKAYYIDTLKEGVDILKDTNKMDLEKSSPLEFENFEILGEKFYYSCKFPLDFSDVIGQERAKRAALISASGFHNILYEGSAGSGKSMIAKRIPFILPPLKLEEILQIASHTLKLSPYRPFKSPHNSATKAAILGSAIANSIKFGEIAQAHLGVLFFDELPHFPKSILESLREPLQNYEFCISRLHAKVVCQTNFMFIGAMNPCPCGNLLNPKKSCRCTDREISSYKNKISEPFWDRMDLVVQMQEGDTSKAKMDSKSMQDFVIKAFKMQKQRGQNCFNSRLEGEELEQFCILDTEAKKAFALAQERFSLSLRSKAKVLRVSRSIADLEGSQLIKKEHLLEALSFRKID
ncbi:Fis family transcriptional regulator [Helicobacter valdiviensis]|uniref:Fis family transcriptional regulator n=1 Tax=Helicobacter valdiviensis TaxID=1458358 RepID=A0A2W6NFN7_9HELI|nr:YifB family Mg chelatase-like AAA ATPase [Helicobacter valdiviensis]PZT47780.1 Fis family transcriptional regulator [Helicobacter valdiviensis]